MLGFVVVLLCVATAALATAAELSPRAAAAFDAYALGAREAFLKRDRDTSRDAALQRGRRLVARAAAEDGIIPVPDGLVHHWIGALVIPDVSLGQALDVSRAYADYPKIYKPVLASRVLDHGEHTFRVLLRIREGAAGISAVLDVWSTVEYFYPRPGEAYAVSTASDIRQVENAGRADERHLPAGMDGGYLWRASTLTRFIERDDGVYVEMETLGLSRRFPPMLGWFIEPIARRLGRRSVEASLEEFRAAVERTRRPQTPVR